MAASSLWAQPQDVGFVQLQVNSRPPIPYLSAIIDEEGRPFVNFNQLMGALELNMRFDAGLQSAMGVLPDGQTSFGLNLNHMRVDVGEQIRVLDPLNILIYRQDLYVVYTELARWFPVSAVWREDAVELSIVTDYVLPSEERRRRELRRAETGAAQGQYSAEDLERELPWFDPGMFRASVLAREGENVNSEYRGTLEGVHRVFKGDLDYTLTWADVNGTSGDPELSRVRLSYYNVLQTSELTFGDTFTVFSPLVLDTITYRGVSFFTGGQPFRYGNTALIGSAAPGSEVDLYRNGILIKFTTTDQTGFYRFDNVPLTQTTTPFEVHIFTPDGRKIIETRQVTTTEAMMQDGQLGFQGGAGAMDINPTAAQFSGVEARYGITSWLTVGGYAVQVEDYEDLPFEDTTTSNSGGFAVLRPLDPLVLLLETAQDQESGSGGSRWNTYFGMQHFSIQADQRSYDPDFLPPARTRETNFSTVDVADTITELTLSGSVWRTNLRLTDRMSDFGESRLLGEQNLFVDRSFSRHWAATLLLEQERYTETAYDTTGLDRTTLRVIYRINSLARAELAQTQVTPIVGESSSQTQVQLQKNFLAESPWSYRASYTNTSDQDDQVLAGLGYWFRNHIRISGQADSAGSWYIQLDFRAPFRVSRDGWESLEPGMYGRAGLEGTVYVDENGDGRRGPEEPPVPGARVIAPGVHDLRADENGHYKGWGLTARAASAIALDLYSTDALYRPSWERRPLVPRPGELIELDIPVETSGGLEGLVEGEGPGALSPASGLTLILTPEAGGKAYTSTVEWDGAFVFEEIPPGRYTLSGDPQKLAALGITLEPAQQPVRLPGGREPTWLTDIRLRATQRR